VSSKWWLPKLVNASSHFTRGTQALERGDFETAVKELEEAVRLEPKMSRYHNNLAFAHFQLKNEPKGWFHMRQAVLIDPANQQAAASFESYWAHLERRAKVRIGAPASEVLSALGQPDLSNESETESLYIWGLKLVRVHRGAVLSIENVLKQ
jgi:tetratricopeptide (TPR) repeat protein